VDQAKNNLTDLQGGAKATDVATAQAALDQAATSRKSAQLKLDGATLKAPFTGVVADITVNVGQAVGANATAVNLIDPRAYHVDMNIGESDISRLKVGQAVDLSFDALAGQVFTGTVTYVAPKATVASGVVSYLATATLDPKAVSDAIKPGMTTTAAAVVEQRSNVLVVPNRAIRTQGRSKVVMVMVGKSQQPVPVTTGINNDQYTEVIGPGLQEGDVIVTSAATTAAPAAGGGIFNLGGTGRGGR